jgi:hypothetical protein
MDDKKVMRVSRNSLVLSRDIAVNQILINSSMHTFGITIYNVLTANPYEVALSILAVKLGFSNKIALALIIAFLL